MALKYSEEELLSESQVRILKCLKFISKSSQSLTREKMIVELLRISNTTLCQNSYLDNNLWVSLQNLMEDLTEISQVLAEIEKRLESAKRDKIKSREACDNTLKVLEDGIIDFYIKIATDEKINSTKDEKLNPIHITQKEFYAKMDEYIQELRKMSEKPQRVIHATTYFEKGKHNHKHNYAPDKKLTEQELTEQVTELWELVIQLQHDHQPTTESEATEVIDAEFKEIKKTDLSRWQTIEEQLRLLKRQVMNPERHISATKAVVSEVAKHYLEESVVGKAIITYLNTMSDDPTHGE